MRLLLLIIGLELFSCKLFSMNDWFQSNKSYGVLDSLARHYYAIDLEQSAKYREQALDIARSLKEKTWIFQSLHEVGKILSDQGDYDKSLSYFEEALDFASSTEDSLNVYADMSRPHQRLGNNDQAASILIQSLELAGQEASDLKIKVLNKLGLFYRGIKEPSKAAAYFRQIPSIMNKVGSERLQIPYINISLVYLDEKEWDSAIFYLKKAYPYLKEQNDNYGLGLYHNNMGTIYFELGQYAEALPEAKKAVELKEKIGSTGGLANTLNLLSGISLGLKDYRNAERYALEALNLQDSSSVDNVRYNSLRYLIESKLGEKNLLEINDLVDELRELNAERFERDKTESIAEAEAKYEVTQKESRLKIQEAELAQKALQRNGLIAGILVLILLSSLIYRSQRIKAKANRELSKKNDEIQELELLKSRWFTNIAHELRTPLTLISGPIEKVLDDENVNAPGKKDLLLARKNVKQLQVTVAEILDISKLEEGQLALEIAPTHVSKMARSAIASFGSLPKQRNVELIGHIQEEVFAKVDESKLNKTLLNLIMNAFKFTPKEGKIELSLEVNDHICFQVKDTGSGISDNDLPHVFDRFFQTMEETKARQGGTGVGLSLTKEIIELHGGEISVNSEPGEGTVFTIQFPKALLCNPFSEEEVIFETFEEEVNSNKSILPEGKKQILLVEDNADMRQYIRDLLKQEYELIEAENGAEGLNILTNEAIDLILSDVMMPVMDGITFAKKVKENSEWSDLPFITLTALANEDDKVHTLRIGVDDYLYKPFNPQELKVRVQNLLKNRRQREVEAEELGFDDELVQGLHMQVKERINDNNLNATVLAEIANMSDRNLRRYLKKLTGLSPIQFIQEIRLMKALELLEQKKYKTLNEVSNAIGINRTSHFSVLFERRFGKRPTEYLI